MSFDEVDKSGKVDAAYIRMDDRPELFNDGSLNVSTPPPENPEKQHGRCGRMHGWKAFTFCCLIFIAILAIGMFLCGCTRCCSKQPHSVAADRNLRDRPSHREVRDR